MCIWCNPETEPTTADYNINGTKYTIGIEFDELVVYRYGMKIRGVTHADMALELPIKYCPMCGAKIEGGFIDEEEEESTECMDVSVP